MCIDLLGLILPKQIVSNPHAIVITVLVAIPVILSCLCFTMCGIMFCMSTGDDFDGGTYYTGFFTNRAASTLDSIPISIPIMDDTISESEECFVCRITDVEGLRCAVPGNNVEKRICIQDNDDVPGRAVYGHCVCTLYQVELCMDTVCVHCIR